MKSQQWMIDILMDLRQVAQRNAMMDLAEKLDDAVIVAAAEMSPKRSVALAGVYGNEARDISGDASEHDDQTGSANLC
ncbi:MAG: hypothetical protein AAGE18_00545 [Pseudomonadota bacterium]